MAHYGRPLAGLCTSTALFVCGVAGFPALPDDLPPATGTLTLDGDRAGVEVAPGAELTLSGGGFADHASVTIGIYSTPQDLGTTTADEAGDIEATVTIPDELTGTHTVTAVGNGPDGDAVVLRTSVSLLDSDAADGPTEAIVETLPRTGIRVGLLALGALGMFLAGFAILRSTVGGRRFLPTNV